MASAEVRRKTARRDAGEEEMEEQPPARMLVLPGVAGWKSAAIRAWRSEGEWRVSKRAWSRGWRAIRGRA